MNQSDIERNKAIIQRIFGKEVERMNTTGLVFDIPECDIVVRYYKSEWIIYYSINTMLTKTFNGYSLARVCCDMKRYIGNQRLAKAVKECAE